VVRAEYQGGYRIHVAFDDCLEATIDFQRWLNGPVFAPMKDLKFFRRFFLDGWTVAWPNGADIAPETLYESVLASGAAVRPNQRLSGPPKNAAAQPHDVSFDPVVMLPACDLSTSRQNLASLIDRFLDFFDGL
jgi:hypothetical protein